MATVLPETPITGDLTPEQIADRIDQAAQLIETDGLEVGGYWTEVVLRSTYEPGDSCCTAGALAVVCGYRRATDVEDEFVGLGGDGLQLHHPVLAAVMAELDFTHIEDVFDWSDASTEREVVGALRDAAAAIRARGAVA